MIRFADNQTAPVIRQMWKICFGDSDEYMDIYFSHKYKNENTLICFVENVAVASLQMLPYSFTFYGRLLPVSYIAGVCTLPEYRKQGYTSILMVEAHRIIAQRRIPIAQLIPAENWLYGFYNKYGYEQVFEEDNVEIPLKQIIDNSLNIKEAYNSFNSIYRNKDFCIQKSLSDFEAIVEEYKYEEYPTKTNLSGMACVIDPKTLLDLYALNNHSKNFVIKLTQNLSNDHTIYHINKGKVTLMTNSKIKADIEVNNRELCRLLFGYKTNELKEPYKSLFPVHYPILNLMLE